MSGGGRATVETTARLSGKGLHTGAAVSIEIRPAAPGRGVRFRRVDLPAQPEVPAGLDAVASTDRGTCLEAGSATVATVEHFLSAVSGLAYDDLLVDVDGPELPIGDGSAAIYLELFQRAGRRLAAVSPSFIRLSKTLTVEEGTANYVVAPSDGLEIEVTIEWSHPSIGRQRGRYTLTPESYETELAWARTFGFASEVETLRARGLALGADPENVIVLTEDDVLGDGLRWHDEFVRHKALDVLGDLALLGGRLKAHVTAHRPSHTGNLAAARAIERAAISGDMTRDDGHQSDSRDHPASLPDAPRRPDHRDRPA